MIVHIYECQITIFKKYCKDLFTFTNSVDPDEMQHYAAFHLGLHFLQNYSFRGFPEYNGLRLISD